MTNRDPGLSHSAAQISRRLEDGTIEEVVGAVERDEHDNWRIVLNDDFGDVAPDMSFLFGGQDEVETFPLLHVRSEHGWFTAVSSRVVSRRRNFGGTRMSRIVLRPQYLIEGSARLNSDELSLTNAHLRFDAPTDWTRWKSWELNTSRNGFERQEHETLRAEFVGAHLELVDSSGWWSNSSDERELFDASDFRYGFDEPIALDVFFETWFRPLVFLVTTGVRHRVRVEHFAISNSGWVSDEDGSPLKDVWLTVHMQNPQRKDRVDGRMLHGAEHFDFAVQVPRVFDSYRDHNDAMEQYLELIHSNLQSHRVRLIATAQMIESFDRSLTPDAEIDADLRSLADRAFSQFAADQDLSPHANVARRSVLESVRPTFASRLSRLDDQSGGLVSELAQSNMWKNDIQLVRNTVVHGLARIAFFARNIVPLQVSTELLEVLFELRLLITFGFTTEEARKILESDPHWWQVTQQIVPYMSAFREFDSFR